MKPEVLDLRGADDPRDVVHRVVERLAHGGLVALPTETVYTVAASALNPAAVERLLAVKNRHPDRPLTLGIKSAQEAHDWVPDLSPLGQRLARRCWPGPVTLVFNETAENGLARQLPEPVRRWICPSGSLSLRVPAHSVVLDCQRLLPWPLALAGANRVDQLGAVTGEEVIQNLGDSIDMVLDDGPCRYGQPSSVVRISGNKWEIIRDGVVTESAMRRLASCHILFVCTGNTCRSPMAEAMCKHLLAKRIGCQVQELSDHGYEIMSAGVAAVSGELASSEAVEVMREMGIDLNDHMSHPLNPETVYQADYIFAMTESHLRHLSNWVPQAAPRMHLLRRDGGSIADPVGLDANAYRQSAADIEENLKVFIEELLHESGCRQ